MQEKLYSNPDSSFTNSDDGLSIMALAASRKIAGFLNTSGHDRVFASKLVDLDRPYKAISEAFIATLSDDEQQAAHAYTRSTFKLMNFWLRMKNMNVEDFPQPYKRWAKTLDGILKKYSVDGPKTLYRGIYDSAFLDGLKAGDIFNDKGYMSTSGNPAITDIFTDSEHPVIMEIKTSKGIPISNRPIEEEYLLARNSSFIVNGVYDKVKFIFDKCDTGSFSGIKLIELEELR